MIDSSFRRHFKKFLSEVVAPIELVRYDDPLLAFTNSTICLLDDKHFNLACKRGFSVFNQPCLRLTELENMKRNRLLFFHMNSVFVPYRDRFAFYDTCAHWLGELVFSLGIDMFARAAENLIDAIEPQAFCSDKKVTIGTDCIWSFGTFPFAGEGIIVSTGKADAKHDFFNIVQLENNVGDRCVVCGYGHETAQSRIFGASNSGVFNGYETIARYHEVNAHSIDLAVAVNALRQGLHNSSGSRTKSRKHFKALRKLEKELDKCNTANKDLIGIVASYKLSNGTQYQGCKHHL